jgi:hypothetical protein
MSPKKNKALLKALRRTATQNEKAVLSSRTALSDELISPVLFYFVSAHGRLLEHILHAGEKKTPALSLYLSTATIRTVSSSASEMKISFPVLHFEYDSSTCRNAVCKETRESGPRRRQSPPAV